MRCLILARLPGKSLIFNIPCIEYEIIFCIINEFGHEVHQRFHYKFVCEESDEVI